ncbi:SPOR domain-containing protein [Dyella silvae]|uniref:SPOR domain-containing protein n=1 Tax=Dyella silvae TaxID=2994424 RepID=UPI0022645707|nr:SPOR domain-containing protein [Dyella silvae]
MAARKGKGRQAVRNNSGGMPGWGWAVIGIAIGAGLMFAMSGRLPMAPRGNQGPQPNAQATAQRGSDAGAAANESTSATDSAPAPKKPQFDFYSVLSEKEVRIPDAVISAQAKAEQQQKQQAAQQAAQAAAQQQAAAAQKPAPGPAAVSEAVTPAPESAVHASAPPAAGPANSSGAGYLLQVGAFPSAADAETLKAKLAMQGFVANVASVSVNGQTYNRVRLGPFHSATELESTKQRLASAGINAIALKEGR